MTSIPELRERIRLLMQAKEVAEQNAAKFQKHIDLLSAQIWEIQYDEKQAKEGHKYDDDTAGPNIRFSL